MPTNPKRKHTKTKSKTKTHQKHKAHPKQELMINRERLLHLVNDINTTRKDLTKMQTNLPAKLMQINAKPNKPQVYAKSVSSSFSSVMHNGHTHSQGKQIVNDSTKPYVQIDEMLNGDVKHYMVPKNTIPYKPSKLLKINTSMIQQKNHSSSKKTKKSKTVKKNKTIKKNNKENNITKK